MRSAPLSSRVPAAEQSFHGARIERASGEMRAHGRRRNDRAEIADGVAPAVVELLGLDDDPGEGAGGERPLTVMTAVDRPASRAARMAALVAVVSRLRG